MASPPRGDSQLLQPLFGRLLGPIEERQILKLAASPTAEPHTHRESGAALNGLPAEMSPRPHCLFANNHFVWKHGALPGLIHPDHPTIPDPQTVLAPTKFGQAVLPCISACLASSSADVGRGLDIGFPQPLMDLCRQLRDIHCRIDHQRRLTQCRLALGSGSCSTAAAPWLADSLLADRPGNPPALCHAGKTTCRR